MPRTTIDLAPDIDARLRALARERGMSLKDVINEALRAAANPAQSRKRKFAMPSRPLGLRQGIDLDKSLQLASRLEDDELVRKLEMRK